MKIFLYTHSFAPLIGGAEKYAMLLAGGIAKWSPTGVADRVEIKVATPTPAGDFDDSKLDFGVVRRPNLFSLTRHIWEADVVHLAGACFAPLFLAWVLRKPTVIEHHGYNASCPNGLLFYEPTQSVCPGHFMARDYGKCIKCNMQKEGRSRSIWMLFWTFLRRWLCQTASVNVPITQYVLNRLALPRANVIYYGIPDSACVPHLLGTLDPNVDKRCFAYVGRLVALKGLPVLIEAARILKEQGYLFRLKFIGDGPQRTVLESLVKTLQLEAYIEFTGFMSGIQFQEKMENVSAVIMPSIWEETAGLAAIEQMMRGRLVIASDIGGLGEIVGEAGLKCSPGHGGSLANCMRRVLDQPELIPQFGSMARARALSLFRQDHMINLYIQVYQDLAKSTKALAGAADRL